MIKKAKVTAAEADLLAAEKTQDEAGERFRTQTELLKRGSTSKEEWRGADSIALLERVYAIIRKEGAHLVNIDSTIVLEVPKLRPHIDAMRERIASTLHIEAKQVSIKATTNEGLGFVGREEGVAAYAVAQVEYD